MLLIVFSFGFACTLISEGNKKKPNSAAATTTTTTATSTNEKLDTINITINATMERKPLAVKKGRKKKKRGAGQEC